MNTPNRWTRARMNQAPEEGGMVCSVREAGLAVMAIVSSAEPPRERVLPTEIRGVIKEWGCMWMWKSLRILGNDGWLKRAIERRTLVAVTDGSYMREMYPEVCSAAFILECREGSGRIVGSFAEGSTHANAYRGELMGLMAIHLILKAADQLWPGLSGRVVVFSDCLGALNKVANLPPHKIPARCRHSDILKNIMVHCTSLSLALAYSRVNRNPAIRSVGQNPKKRK